MLRKLLLLLLLASLAGSELYASHYMGGEISWECLPNGNHRFVVRLYRECGGVLYPVGGITLGSNSPAGNIYLRLYPDAVLGRRDISPVCNSDTSFSRIQCMNASPPQPSNQGAVEEWTYTSDAIYPNGIALNGIPPANGWIFYYNSCCRNPCSNILGASSKSWYLRAVMYNYDNQPKFPCSDHSPAFAEGPATVICAGYPYYFHHRAHDKEGDSLAFEWGIPLENGVTSPIVGWAAGYSYDNPLPNSYHDTNNVAAVMDPGTGNISLTSFTQGAFLTTTKVTAYKCGMKAAEVFREIQMVIISCDSNPPPTFTLSGATQVTPQLFTSTFQIGDTVKTYIIVSDTSPMYLPNGQLVSVRIDASGKAFGDGFISDTSGCLFKPCATLDPPAPYSNPLVSTAVLSWVIGPEHYFGDPSICGTLNPVHDFWFDVRDDVCPIPGQNSFTYRIIVDYPGFGHFDGYCMRVDTAGDVHITWDTISDVENIFSRYVISYAPVAGSPFQILDTLHDINITSFIHYGANAQQQPGYYKLDAYFNYKGKNVIVNMFNDSPPYIDAPSHACISEPFTISLNDPNQATGALIWDLSSVQVISGSGPGPYVVQVDSIGTFVVGLQKTGDCGTSVLLKTIQVHPPPQVSVLGKKYYCPGSPVVLQATGAQTYQWSSGHSTAQISLPQVQWPINLTVTGWDTVGCKDTEMVYIRGIETWDNNPICLVTNDINSNNLQIIWEPEPHVDIQAYRISWLNGTIWTPLDSIPFDMAGVYTDNLHNAGQMQYLYRLQAVDSCGRLSEYSDSRGTIRLQAVAWGQVVTLSWLPYVGPLSYSHIQIYRYDDVSGVFSLIDSVPANNITYIDQNPPYGNLLYYLVIHGQLCEPAPGITYSSAYSNTSAVAFFAGIPEFASPVHLRVLPDKLRQCLDLIWLQQPGSPVTLTLLDATGREVLRHPLNGQENRETVFLPRLPGGVYFYQVQDASTSLGRGKIVWP